MGFVMENYNKRKNEMIKEKRNDSVKHENVSITIIIIYYIYYILYINNDNNNNNNNNNVPFCIPI